MSDTPPAPTSVLELALGAKSKIAVLRILFQSKPGFSGAALARHTRMGLLAIQSTLSTLEHMGLVEADRGSREHRYRLNGQHYLVTNGLQELFEGEKRMRLSLAKELRTLLQGKVVCAGLFGSFARGDTKAESDIDLFVIVESLKDKERISEILSDAQNEISRRYGWPLQFIVYEKKQLSGSRSKVRNLLEQAERDWHHVAGLQPADLLK